MSNPTLSRLKRVLDILTPVSLGVSAACLMGSCVSIYRAGEFTREIVAARFAPISLPCCLSLALIAAGWLLSLFLPQETEKPKAGRQTELILARLQAKADLSAFEEGLRTALAAQQRKRSRLALIRVGTLLVCSMVFLIYALNGSNFHTTQINASMIRAMAVLVPCLLISGAVSLVTGQQRRAVMEEEIALLKKAPSRSPVQKSQAEAPASAKKLSVLRTVILVTAISLLVFGFLTGGTADVLTKAVNICTECVGLG